MKTDSNLTQPLNPSPQRQKSSQHQLSEQAVSEETARFLRKLEGDCRIKSHIFLKINYLKLVFLAVPWALTVVGLVLLYQFKALRVALLFTRLPPTNKHLASHILVESSSGITGICKLKLKVWRRKEFYLFSFQELLYEIFEDGVMPLGIKVKEEIEDYLCASYLQQGLSQEQASNRLQFFGRNQHLVKIPTYYEYIFNILFLSLFSYLQYLTSFIFFLENLGFYSILIIGMNFVTSTVNYILIRISYMNIKKIAQKKHYVSVLRSKAWREIESSQLVPGDIYKPSQIIACDSIVLKEDLFVSEVGFTGETIPIGKFTLNQAHRAYQSQHWVYEGSEIISMKKDCLVMAVNTGYSTRKGRIIRKILNPKPQDNELFLNIIKQTVFMLFMMIICYFAFFHTMFDGVQDRSIVLIIFASFVVQSIPSSLPIFINVSYSIMLLRLRFQGIMGLLRQKTTESSRLETICFDKTGTLTEIQTELKSIMIPNKSNQGFQTINAESLPENQLLHMLFATCHTVRQLNGKLHGDQIDLQMFKASHVIMKEQGLAQGAVFEVQGEKEDGKSLKLEVLRVHQFESRFQSMSVIVRDIHTGQAYLFAKGSPEKLHSLSTVSLPRFADIIRELSLEGMRSIAVSYKKIKDIRQALLCDRQKCLEGTEMFGIVTFANKLKPDAQQTIKQLSEADIGVKMVTGDNIFVAIQAALMLEIVPYGCRILALEGSRLQPDGSLTAVAVHRDGTKIFEQEINIPVLIPRALQGQYLAMDAEFLRRSETIFLECEISIFARATPQMKAVILKKEKEKLALEYKARTWSSRTFGGRQRKVGMVGDGANDLMAIRESDVGIGISNSDAVYGSDFTITNLSQVITIIREGKAGQAKMLDLAAFLQFMGFGSNIMSVLITSDLSVMAFIPTLLKNFGFSYFGSIFIALTRPAEKLTRYCPAFNMIGLQFILIWWGNAVIASGGVGVAYLYYKQSSDFEPNPDRSLLNGKNKAATIIFLTLVLVIPFVYISFSGSYPFKKPFYSNLPLVILLTFAFTLMTCCFFLSEYLHVLQLQPIARKEALVVYAICIVTGLMSIIYGRLIRSAQLYKEQFPKKQGGFARLKQLSHSV